MLLSKIEKYYIDIFRVVQDRGVNFTRGDSVLKSSAHYLTMTSESQTICATFYFVEERQVRTGLTHTISYTRRN